jgi:single-strand DNA-binding protein
LGNGLVAFVQTANLTTFTIATNEFRGGGAERAEYHPCVAWDRLAEICGQFLSKGQLVDVEGRLQTRQWDDDAGKRHWKTEVVVGTLEMLSGRSKKEYAKEAEAVAAAPDGAPAANGAAENDLEAVVAM